MVTGIMQDIQVFRVTLFFGPEPVEGKGGTVACVFNVKKRSWKAGIQVAVEIERDQLTTLRHSVRLEDRLVESLMTVNPGEVLHYQERAEDVFAQAVCRCKLDLQLRSGLTQENQQIAADVMMDELDEEVSARREEIVAFILGELDLIPS